MKSTAVLLHTARINWDTNNCHTPLPLAYGTFVRIQYEETLHGVVQTCKYKMCYEPGSITVRDTNREDQAAVAKIKWL